MPAAISITRLDYTAAELRREAMEHRACIRLAVLRFERYVDCSASSLNRGTSFSPSGAPRCHRPDFAN